MHEDDVEVTALARRFTQELVRLDTTSESPGEVAGLETVAGWFAERGDLEVILREDADGEPTGLVVVPRGEREDLLLLSSHVDTVPADPSGWTHDPWGAEIVDGWLYGRGASDMKSGLAAQAAALLSAPAGCRAGFAVSRNEENGCRGTLEVIEALRGAGASAGALIVGEPTDGELVLGHKGPLWVDVTTEGVAAHGSTPELGVSAIAAMSDLIARAARELPLREHPELGRESVNIGRIVGGTIRNAVPEHCAIAVDMRTVDADPEPLLAWWRAQPEVAQVIIDTHLPALWTSPEDPWVASLQAPLAPRPVGFGTEAGLLAAAFELERAVIWGPGPMSSMHAVDERVRLTALDEAARGYRAAVLGWDPGTAAG